MRRPSLFSLRVLEYKVLTPLVKQLRKLTGAPIQSLAAAIHSGGEVSIPGVFASGDERTVESLVATLAQLSESGVVFELRVDNQPVTFVEFCDLVEEQKRSGGFGAPTVLHEYRPSLTIVNPGDPQVDPEALGRRTKFGGSPDFIQDDKPPPCPYCGRMLRFIAQIDSLEHSDPTNPTGRVLDQHFMFGDVGMIYVWFCFECLEPQAIFSCY